MKKKKRLNFSSYKRSLNTIQIEFWKEKENHFVIRTSLKNVVLWFGEHHLWAIKVCKKIILSENGKKGRTFCGIKCRFPFSFLGFLIVP
jgi:hypothetical protein